MRTKIAVYFAALLACLPLNGADSAKIVKIWNFDLPHGGLRIYLRSFPNGTSDLAVTPLGGRPQAAPIAEQVGALKQVMADMPGLGVKPGMVVYLGTRLIEPDVIKKLAYACVDSRDWRLSMKKHGKGKESLVVALLNQSGAYKAYDEAFKPFGIRATVTTAEHVGLMRFSQVPRRNADDRKNANILVPADAMIGMRFSKLN